jgi:hypothetical protein
MHTGLLNKFVNNFAGHRRMVRFKRASVSLTPKPSQGLTARGHFWSQTEALALFPPTSNNWHIETLYVPVVNVNDRRV